MHTSKHKPRVLCNPIDYFQCIPARILPPARNNFDAAPARGTEAKTLIRIGPWLSPDAEASAVN